MQPVQVKLRIDSTIRPCSLSATALQRLQDTRPLDIWCISSNPPIISMHDVGYPPKIHAHEEEANAWDKLRGRCLASATDRSTWEQVEPAVLRWAAILNIILNIISSTASNRWYLSALLLLSVQEVLAEDNLQFKTWLVWCSSEQIVDTAHEGAM